MVYFRKEAHDKIRAIVAAFGSMEVAMYGFVIEEQNETRGTDLIVEDIFVPIQQIIQSAHVKTETEGDFAAGQWEEQKQAEYNGRGRVIAHFHSHNNMGVTPSATDLSDWTSKSTTNQTYIVGIFNNRDEKTIRLCSYGHIFDIPFKLYPSQETNTLSTWATGIYAEVKEYNKTKPQIYYGAGRLSDDYYDNLYYNQRSYDKQGKKKNDKSVVGKSDVTALFYAKAYDRESKTWSTYAYDNGDFNAGYIITVSEYAKRYPDTKLASLNEMYVWDEDFRNDKNTFEAFMPEYKEETLVTQQSIDDGFVITKELQKKLRIIPAYDLTSTEHYFHDLYVVTRSRVFTEIYDTTTGELITSSNKWWIDNQDHVYPANGYTGKLPRWYTGAWVYAPNYEQEVRKDKK